MKKRNTKEYEFLVVGAGIAGLTLGYKLTRQKKKVLLVERDGRVGGLAKSFKYRFKSKDFYFDIGPKRFHTDDKEVLNFIYEVLGKERIYTGRKSSIFAFNNYFNWPLTPSDLMKLPFLVRLEIGFDLIWKIFKRKGVKEIRRFDEYVIEKYGKSLYEYFFRGYTGKFVCTPVEKIHADWASTGVNRSIIDKKAKGASIFDLLRSILLPVPVKTTFVYPKKDAFGYFVTRLKKLIEGSDGKVICGKEIESLDYKKHEILIGGERYKFKKLIWTGNIHDLERLLGTNSSSLRYLSTIFYNFVVKTSKIRDDQWIYYHYKKPTELLEMVRVSIPSNFAKYLMPRGYKGICVEKTCFENDGLWNNPKVLLEKISEELIEVKLIDRKEVIKKVFVEPVRDTYPVLDLKYKENFECFSKNIRMNYPDIKLLGRLGSFWYNNADHSIKAALGMFDYLIGKRKIEPTKENIFS